MAFAREGAACRGTQVIAPTGFGRDRHSTHVPFSFQSSIVDVYSVGPRKCEPFTMKIRLVGKESIPVEVKGLVDDGAMVAAMDTEVFHRLREALDGIKPSSKRLRMANGAVVHSQACWEGTIIVGDVKATGEFEVFDSGGGWDFLFGKPLLRAFKALHDYECDTITVKGPCVQSLLANAKPAIETENKMEVQMVENEDVFYDAEEGFDKADWDDDDDYISEEEEWMEAVQFQSPETPKVTVEDELDEEEEEQLIKMVERAIQDRLRAEQSIFQRMLEKQKVQLEKERTEHIRQMWKEDLREQWKAWKGTGKRRWYRWNSRASKPAKLNRAKSSEHSDRMTTTNDMNPDVNPSISVDIEATERNPGVCIFEIDSVEPNLYTRNMGNEGAFRKERVDAIMKLIKIGDDLTPDQRQRVQALLRSYADCFALSVSEVRPVEGAVHRLNIPENTTFSKKVHQRPLTPPQKEYLHSKIDEMLAAGIIESCHPEQVKCVSPTTLAQKAHEGGGLSLEELQHKVNDQCITAGLEPFFNLPSRPSSAQSHNETKNTSANKPPKWRICQNFGEVNRVTEIAPMPQGDIRLKQLNVSGHRWLMLFDFASGFYALEVAEESRPYTAFYVEGRGYFWYKRMPFGLTGAPSSFAHMTATHLHDLLAEGTIELFVDDGATGVDNFEDGLQKLTRLLNRVRERNLSLSASKSEFFVTEGVFAGAKVGPRGVTSDPAKLTAIVDWKQPADALNLASFLGITGHFRDLIKDYAKIEGPLRELIKEVQLPSKHNKSTYRKAMETHKLTERWSERHTKAFIGLKAALANEPVLKAPRWDGTHFILTTDGCKEGFAGVLTQKVTSVLPNGKVVEKIHPIAFASKRTSTSEHNYKPFLLEFAALKFSLDKFSDIVWGFPVEIETDCQALRDVLISDKLNAAHSHWRDGILAHQIVDVRHVPGKINVVADGMSRTWEGLSREVGDGSEWSVSEDWESVHGLHHDIFSVTSQETDFSDLRQRFADEPLFLEVVEALQGVQTSGTL